MTTKAKISRGDIWWVDLDPTVGPISWHVPIESQETGLDKTSYIICNEVRTVSIDRFKGKPLGTIKSNILKDVEERLRILLCL